MSDMFWIFVSAAIVTNFVLVYFLGLCPVIVVNAPYLRVIAFIVAIASVVQIVELFIRKTSPGLYRELGIFLPLIASNSQVLGLTIFQTNRGYTLLEGLMFAVGGGLGITAVLAIVGSMRERLEFAPIPTVARGPALVFFIVAALSLVFMGFAGMGTV